MFRSLYHFNQQTKLFQKQVYKKIFVQPWGPLDLIPNPDPNPNLDPNHSPGDTLKEAFSNSKYNTHLESLC